MNKTKFKAGTRVYYVDSHSGQKVHGVVMQDDDPSWGYTTTSMGPQPENPVWAMWEYGNYHTGPSYMFESRVFFADPIQNHIDALIEAGYTITPPKPKRQGQIMIVEHKSVPNPIAVRREIFEQWSNSSDYTVLAILDWVEGQGLEP